MRGSTFRRYVTPPPVRACRAFINNLWRLCSTISRIVVAIFAQAPKVDLFRFFWRELQLIGVRVYEPEDYDKAITLAASHTLPIEQLITGRQSLHALHDVFTQMAAGAETMKILIDTQGA